MASEERTDGVTASSCFSAQDVSEFTHRDCEGTLHGRTFYPHIVSCLHGLEAINTFRHKQPRGGNPTVTPAVRALKMTEADRTSRRPDRKSMAFGSAQPALTLLGLPEPCHTYGSEVSAASWGIAATDGEKERAPGRN